MIIYVVKDYKEAYNGYYPEDYEPYKEFGKWAYTTRELALAKAIDVLKSHGKNDVEKPLMENNEVVYNSYGDYDYDYIGACYVSIEEMYVNETYVKD